LLVKGVGGAPRHPHFILLISQVDVNDEKDRSLHWDYTLIRSGYVVIKGIHTA
jgi:hypothetical protein